MIARRVMLAALLVLTGITLTVTAFGWPLGGALRDLLLLAGGAVAMAIIAADR